MPRASLNHLLTAVFILMSSAVFHSYAQMTFVGQFSDAGLSNFQIVSESKARSVKASFFLSNSDSSVVIRQQVELNLQAGFNRMPAGSIQSDTIVSNATDLRILAKAGLPAGNYQVSVLLEEANGKLWYAKHTTLDYYPELLEFKPVDGDSIQVSTDFRDTAQLVLSYRTRNDTLTFLPSETGHQFLVDRPRNVQLLLGGSVWESLNTQRSMPQAGLDSNRLAFDKASGPATFLKRAFSMDQLTLTSTAEYYEHPLPGNLYDYPLAMHQVNGVMSVGGIPFRAEGFLFMGQQFTPASIRSPMNYFRLSYDEELWKNQKLDARSLSDISSEITSQQYEALSNRNQTLAEIDALKAKMPVARNAEIDSLNTDSLPSGMSMLPQGAGLSQKEQKRLEKLQRKKQQYDVQLAKLKARQEKVEQLTALGSTPSSDPNQFTRKALAVDSLRFGKWTPRLNKIKSIQIGNIFPTRFGYSPLYYYYPQLQGVSAEYRVTDNTRIYSLIGRSRSGPFDWSDSLQVIEGGVAHTFKGHQVSVIVSRIRPRIGAASSETANYTNYGQMIEPTLEFRLSKRTKAGVSSSFYIGQTGDADSSLFDQTRNMLYVISDFGGLSTETYAELSMSEYQNPIELSAQPDLLRAGSRVNWLFAPLKVTFTAGLVYTQTGLLTETTSDRQNVQVELGLQTSFRKWPNLLMRYTPFAGFQTAQSTDVNAVIAYQQNTTSLISALTWQKTLNRHTLSTMLSYQRVSNVLLLSGNNEPVSEAVIESYSWNTSLLGSKEKIMMGATAFVSDTTTSAQLQASYLRTLGKVVSIGGTLAGGEQQGQRFVRAGVPVILRVHPKLSFQLEGGRNWFDGFRDTGYARVQAVYAFMN